MVSDLFEFSFWVIFSENVKSNMRPFSFIKMSNRGPLIEQHHFRTIHRWHFYKKDQICDIENQVKQNQRWSQICVYICMSNCSKRKVRWSASCGGSRTWWRDWAPAKQTTRSPSTLSRTQVGNTATHNSFHEKCIISLYTVRVTHWLNISWYCSHIIVVSDCSISCRMFSLWRHSWFSS